MTIFKYMDWRVDPDHRQDRQSGPVVEYELNPEELKKYENIKCDKKKPVIIDVEEMVKNRDKKRGKRKKACNGNDIGEEKKIAYNKGAKRKHISMLQMLALCKKYGGVSYEAIEAIAKETGLTKRTIEKYIDEYCIIPNLHSGLE